MTVDIDSPQNARVKEWVGLRRRRERDRTGAFLVEGERETLRAAAHLDVVVGIVRDDRVDIDLPERLVVSARVFDRLSTRQHPDGVAAVLRSPDLRLDRFTPPGHLVLVGDGIEKPGNIGAMIRSADAFGAGFLGSELGTDLVNRNVIRSAQGSLFRTPTGVASRPEAIAWARAFGQVLVAVADDAATAMWNADLTGPTCLVIGREHDGVHPDWAHVADAVTIPTQGAADSLNASVAAAVLLAEARRQGRS